MKKKAETAHIAGALAAATSGLLGLTPVTAVHAQEEPNWDFNTALLYYGESDDRVQDISATVLARRLFSDDRSLTMTLAVDSLTGATPSGATPLDTVQTFTRPSGKKTYEIAAGELPLDDTFLDTRVALSASWQQPLGRLYSGSAGFSFSKEYDYLHSGVNARLSRDFYKRNTTLSVGLAFARDEFDPVGGAPNALSPMLGIGDLSNRSGADTKNVADLLVGVTQIINERFLMQFNYSFSDASGYLNDPYKILSVVDPVTGDTLRRPAAVDGPSHEYRFESRPDGRTKHSAFLQGKYYLSGKTIDVSYRYMTDDWQIDSHTLDAKFRLPLKDTSYLEPHVRFYSQTEADFFRASLIDGAALPIYASADYRLAAFDAITAGIKYGWETASGNAISVRLEYYTQDGEIPASQIIGNQRDRELYPGLDAIIFNLSYRFSR